MDWAEIISFVCYMGASHLWGYHRGQMSRDKQKRAREPYSWSCEVCRDQGKKFEMSTNMLEGLDAVILDHKASHERG